MRVGVYIRAAMSPEGKCQLALAQCNFALGKIIELLKSSRSAMTDDWFATVNMHIDEFEAANIMATCLEANTPDQRINRIRRMYNSAAKGMCDTFYELVSAVGELKGTLAEERVH
jgi:hypothetical protein